MAATGVATLSAKNRNKRPSNVGVEELMAFANGEDDNDEQDEEFDGNFKHQKISKQAVFERDLANASNPKIRNFIIRDVFDRKEEEIKLSADQYQELLFGYVVGFDFLEAIRVYEAFPKEIKELPEVDQIWQLAQCTEGITSAFQIRNGFGTGGFGSSLSSIKGGFGNPQHQHFEGSIVTAGFGKARDQQAPPIGGFGSRICAQGFSFNWENPGGFGKSPEDLFGMLNEYQLNLAKALKKARGIQSKSPIISGYLCEFKKRGALAQLKSVHKIGNPVEMSMMQALLGFDALCAEGTAEVQSVVRGAGLVFIGCAVSMNGHLVLSTVNDDYGYFRV